jgi:hypothetical protein
VVGRITRLRSESDPSDLLHPVGAREVLVQWQTSEFGEISVKVLLPPDQYLAAVEAHKNGQAISVSGMIEHVGRTWTLLNPTNFSVVP